MQENIQINWGGPTKMLTCAVRWKKQLLDVVPCWMLGCWYCFLVAQLVNHYQSWNPKCQRCFLGKASSGRTHFQAPFLQHCTANQHSLIGGRATHLKNISQNGNLHQIGVKIKNIWNHHLVLSQVAAKVLERRYNILHCRLRQVALANTVSDGNGVLLRPPTPKRVYTSQFWTKDWKSLSKQKCHSTPAKH